MELRGLFYRCLDNNNSTLYNMRLAVLGDHQLYSRIRDSGVPLWR